MTAAQRFSALARKYGQPVTVALTDGDTAKGYGFIQPFMTENKDYLWQRASELGTYDGVRFRFYGEAGLASAQEDFTWLSAMGQRYNVQEIQPIYLGENIVYWWGVLTVKDEEDDCI